MSQDKQIECRISWDNILSSSNPEQLIFRTLQLADIDAYVNYGRFETSTGKLHLIDDITTKERVYVWCPAIGNYPFCTCITCSDRRTMNHYMNYYTLDFKCQLIQELYNCGAIGPEPLWHERARVHEIVQRDRELADRRRQDMEVEERRRRDQAEAQAQQLQAQERRRELRRIQGLEKQARNRAKKLEEETIVVRVQEQQQVRHVRLED